VKRVLVTGSTGFLGRHLLNRLKKQPGEWHIYGVGRNANSREWEEYSGPTGRYIHVNERLNLACQAEVAGLMKRFRPQVVFHLAGNPLVNGRPFDVFQANVDPTHYLLESCEPGTRFVFASSAAVYGDPAVRGGAFGESSSVNPTSVYGASKAAGEALVRAYTAQGRVRGMSARLIANCGAWATHGLVRDLVRKAKSAEPYLSLLGDFPGSCKPMAYAGDTAEALAVLGLECSTTGHVNVGPDDNLSVGEIADIVLDALGIDKPLSWAGEASTWKGDNPHVHIDNFYARSLLAWNPKYPTTAEAVRAGVKELEAFGC
jgi:UDP-glucose 4-epimerase